MREQDIVDTFNDLVEKLGNLPYLRTNLSQLRVLRMWTALFLPKFMGVGIARQNTAIDESISPTMGPAQAAHLIAALIDAKVFDPDFLVTPQEWETVSLQKVMEKIQTAQARLAVVRATGKPIAILEGYTYSPERRRELEQTLYPRISSFSTAEGLNLIEQTLAKLRID